MQLVQVDDERVSVIELPAAAADADVVVEEADEMGVVVEVSG